MSQRQSGKKQATGGRLGKRGAAKKRPERKTPRGQHEQQHSTVDDDRLARESLKKYGGHPALQNDCAYAFPSDLIQAILQELPEFLSLKDEGFECALAKSCGSGFFLKQSLFLISNAKIRQQQREMHSPIRRILAEELWARGRSDLQIQEYIEKQHEIDQKLQLRQRSFAGWLVTNPQFRRECRGFCKFFETRFREDGRFRPMPFSFVGVPPIVSEENREYYDACMSFYKRWNLDTIVSWDLPVPMRADVVTPSLYHLDSLRDAGITVFLPWFQFRDRDITLRDLADWRQLGQRPDHLEDWFDHRPDN
jgi:hypothetical protein